VLLGHAGGATTLLGRGLAAVQFIEVITGIGHGGGR
jgi:hypothetical protein